MWKVNEGSILIGGIPVERGRAAHVEHEGEGAYAAVDFNIKTGKVEVIHTPPEPFLRAHEMMHARHTDVKRAGKRMYKGIVDPVYQISEDVRLHANHWLWHRGHTPREIELSARAYIAKEQASTEERLKEEPEKRGTWPDFATRLRQCAVRYGLGEGLGTVLNDVGFADDKQVELASRIMKMMMGSPKQQRQAAVWMQTIFFPPLESGNGKDDGSRSGIKTEATNGKGDGDYQQPHMDVIELPHTVNIPEARRGYRRATSGGRLHRPSLRKPVIPQRLFLRRTPREAHGTILVDASGSMGDWRQIMKWCEKAPFGTIAYYAGNGKTGKLFVYARNGKRAERIVKPGCGGNTVDGPAISWLLTQAKPRLMITDRGFCDVPDSTLQVFRLAELERAGEITVQDYAHDPDAEPLPDDDE